MLAYDELFVIVSQSPNAVANALSPVRFSSTIASALLRLSMMFFTFHAADFLPACSLVVTSHRIVSLDSVRNYPHLPGKPPGGAKPRPPGGGWKPPGGKPATK